MAEDRLIAWEILFRRALEIIDSVAASGARFDDWSFGGGTVLMRRYRHRVSKDVDFFVPDPQYLGYVSPRLNDTVDSLTSKHLDDRGDHREEGRAPRPGVHGARQLRLCPCRNQGTRRDRIHQADPARAKGDHPHADCCRRESVAHGIFGTRYPGIQTGLRRMRQDRRGCARQELIGNPALNRPPLSSVTSSPRTFWTRRSWPCRHFIGAARGLRG